MEKRTNEASKLASQPRGRATNERTNEVLHTTRLGEQAKNDIHYEMAAASGRAGEARPRFSLRFFIVCFEFSATSSDQLMSLKWRAYGDTRVRQTHTQTNE